MAVIEIFFKGIGNKHQSIPLFQSGGNKLVTND